MKMNYLGITALALVLSCGAYSCGSSGKNEKKDTENETVTRDLKFESYTFDMMGKYIGSDSLISPDEAYVKFTSQGVLPRDLGDAAIKTLRDSLMSLVGIVDGDEGKPVPALPDSMEVVTVSGDSLDDTGYEYSTLSATLVTPRVVVWEAYRESYMWHAAHGNLSMSYLNYSLEDARILSLSDLMNPGYEKKLTEQIREKIKEEGISLLCDLNEVEIPKQFAITSTGILFSYDPYDIAPYSEGVVTVDLPMGDIVDILSPKGIYLITGVTPSEE